MIKILNESLQEVRDWLTSKSCSDMINSELGADSNNDLLVSEFLSSMIEEEYGESSDIEEVTVYRVDNRLDIVGTGHVVLRFNGYFYDFTADKFSDSFNGLIRETDLPVVQKVVRSENQLSPRLSSIKYYAMLGDS